VLIVLGVPAWYAGSALLRIAAFGSFVFAGIGLLLAGHDDQSPWAAVAFAGFGVACWAAGHTLHRACRGSWATPMAAGVFSGRLPRRRRALPHSGVAHGHARRRR
jgi:hypothetical protein